MKKVFVNVKFTEEQKKRLESICDCYSFVYELDKDADIIIGNYPADKLKEFKNLQWIQSSAVGVDNYIKKGVLADNVVLTNAVDIHSEEVAEHVLGMMFTLLKKQHLYRDNQRKYLWHDEGKVKQISGLRVAIVGLGDIGNTLAKLLKSLNMYVIGVKRKMVDKPDYIDELYLNDDMEKAISNVDVVVTLLPGNKENVHLFTLDTFKAMASDTILINAGRGSLYSEEVLKEVLDNHIIEAIGMDVFENEPVSADSPLWDYDNLLITPHVAGFFHLDSAKDKYLDLVEENLRRYCQHETLLNVVDDRE